MSGESETLVMVQFTVQYSTVQHSTVPGDGLAVAVQTVQLLAPPRVPHLHQGIGDGIIITLTLTV